MAGTVFVRHGDTAQEFSVGAEATIGRAPDNQIVLSDLAVSRHHASVRMEGGAWRIVDLGSAGGTRVGDTALEPRVPHAMKPGELVAIGPYMIELAAGSTPSAGPTIVAGGAATIVAPSAAAAGATQILIPRPRILVTSPEGTRVVDLTGDKVTFGRDDTQGVNDVVVKVAQVSSRHLEFRRLPTGGYEVEDLGSTNGTTFGGQRIQRRVLQEGDRFDIAGTVQIVYTAQPELEPLPAAGEDHALDLAGKGTITIGRDQSCDVRLSQPTVSKQHARIVTTADGHGRAIEDLGSTNGTFVNGERVVPGAPRVLKPDDEIRVGLVKLVFSAESLEKFDDSHAVGLDAVGLNQRIGQGVNLLKNISFSIQPNEFVAVVGTSGAGKSTLLNALSGLKPASEGAVLLNGQELYRHYEAFRSAMGFVPQDDILHKELPVGRALEYAAELRLPDDTTPQERHERVRDVIKKLGLEERRDVAIGSLSGGQRKRVSIGAELLTEPGLFFLDEATSGLDPGIEAQLMRLLRGLADEGHTIVLITHATKNVMLCDQVVFLARGGYLAYYGPPDKALEHFEVEDFDGIYEKLDAELTPEQWAQRATKSPTFNQYVTARLAAHGITGGVETVPRTTVAPPPVRHSSGIRQLRVLARRYFDIIRRDRVNFALLFVLAPALGSMDFIAWKRHTLTFMNGDTGQALSMLFLASLIPFLVGALSNVREIVKEAPIYAPRTRRLTRDLALPRFEDFDRVHVRLLPRRRPVDREAHRRRLPRCRPDPVLRVLRDAHAGGHVRHPLGARDLGPHWQGRAGDADHHRCHRGAGGLLWGRRVAGQPRPRRHGGRQHDQHQLGVQGAGRLRRVEHPRLRRHLPRLPFTGLWRLHGPRRPHSVV